MKILGIELWNEGIEEMEVLGTFLTRIIHGGA